MLSRRRSTPAAPTCKKDKCSARFSLFEKFFSPPPFCYKWLNFGSMAFICSIAPSSCALSHRSVSRVRLTTESIRPNRIKHCNWKCAAIIKYMRRLSIRLWPIQINRNCGRTKRWALNGKGKVSWGKLYSGLRWRRGWPLMLSAYAWGIGRTTSKCQQIHLRCDTRLSVQRERRRNNRICFWFVEHVRAEQRRASPKNQIETK